MNIVRLLVVGIWCVQAGIESAKRLKSKLVSWLTLEIEEYPSVVLTNLFKWITSTGGSREMSNFLIAPVDCLHCGQVHPSMNSPSKYKSRQSNMSHCWLSCGSSKLKCEKPSYVALSKWHDEHLTVLRIWPKNNEWIILCIFFKNSRQATSALFAFSFNIAYWLENSDF